jgi:hypothetical protein
LGTLNSWQSSLLENAMSGLSWEMLVQALRGPADPLRDPGPWSLDLGAWTLGLSRSDLRATWDPFGAILGIPGAILGLSCEVLKVAWVNSRASLGHPGAILGLSWVNLGAIWVQGHLVEMLKSLSLCACAVKTVA